MLQQQGRTAGAKIPHLPMFLQSWVSLTSPAVSRQPQWREEIASLIYPIIFLMATLALPVAVTSNNTPQTIILSFVTLVLLVALVLKKRGYFLLAGVLIAGSIECGLASALFTVAGGIDISQLPLYALLIQTGFVIIAFFSPAWIWIAFFGNSILTVCTLTSLHRPGTELAVQLAKDPASIIFPMILLHFFVAFVCWMIMSALIRAIARADNAEDIARLEEERNKQQEEQLKVSRQVEDGIEKILAVLNTATTNADFSARVPLSQENILWRIGRALNNLLARLQGLRNTHQELEKTRAIATQLAELIREGRTVPLEKWTGTCLDPVIIEINKLRPAQGMSPTPGVPMSPSPPNPTGSTRVGGLPWERQRDFNR